MCYAVSLPSLFLLPLKALALEFFVGPKEQDGLGRMTEQLVHVGGSEVK